MKSRWFTGTRAGTLLIATAVGCGSQGSGGGTNGGGTGASSASSGAGSHSAGSPASGGAGGSSPNGTGGSGGSAGEHASGVGGAAGATATGGANANAGTSAGGQVARGGDGGLAGGTTGGSASGGDAAGGIGGLAGMVGAGASGMAGAAGACMGAGCGAPSVICYPTLPGAVASTLYTVTGNGTPMFVEQLTKFTPEMQVHYAHCSLSGPGTATFSVTLSGSFTNYKLSPKSRNLSVSKSGNTLTFDSGPNYLILQVDSKDLLFILIDGPEVSPPKLGDANVKNIADYNVDATGATLATSKIQSAIDAASTATQNVLYFPPGKYQVGELWMKSNVTLYLAGGAVLYGSGNTADFNTGNGGIDIEDAQHALIRMYQIQNAKILGRGVLDSNGHAIRGAGLNANLLKIEQSSNITIDGIVSRDPSYWNTLVYRSDQVAIHNYKVINCRPTTGSTVYNQTDGVDFDESTNGLLDNAFLYTGDDGMATKNEEASGVINTKNITHQHVVVYNNSVGCKIGTKSMGQSIDAVTFKDIDVVKAGRGMTIEAYDTAVVSNTTFEDVRIEAADSMLVNLALDQPPTWRTAADTGIYKDTYFTNVSSDVKQVISLHGESSSANITGVHFKNFTVQGKAITSQTDADVTWDINSFVSNISFE